MISNLFGYLAKRKSTSKSVTKTIRSFYCTIEAMTEVIVNRSRPGVVIITINRPTKRNCVNNATAIQLIKAFEHFENDHTAKVVILNGKGENFCAGYDLSEVATGSTLSNDDYKSFLEKFRPMGPSMMQLSKPVIAAVEGYAVAGGIELASMCDMRVCDTTAKFGVFCRRFGVPLIDGGTVRLPRLIGLSRAMDMILTGREIDAQTAFHWGLANRLVPQGKALEEALQLATELMQFPQATMNADKKSAMYAAYSAKSFQDAFDFELNNGLPVLDEAAKGASKFVSGSGKHGRFEENNKSKL